MPHVTRTTWAGISADIEAAVTAVRGDPGSDDEQPQAVFTLGFCMGGRMSFLAATLGLDLAGVIGLYGTLAGPWRNDAPAPLDLVGSFESPVLGLFGGADQGITRRAGRGVRRGARRGRRGASDRDLPGRPAQLLRPQGGRVRGRERGGLGRDPRLHREALRDLATAGHDERPAVARRPPRSSG